LALSIVAIVGTYSRGGFVGLVVVGGAFLVSSRKKSVPLLTTVAVVGAVLMFAPGDWFDRVNTIQSYKEDSSSVGRLNSWQTAWNLAQDRPVIGGGFAATENPRIYRRYKGRGDSTDSRAAHSIYFQVLGDLGFVGLGLYIAMLGAGVYNLLLVQRWTTGREDLDWANMLARMLLVSTVGFVTAGALLSMAYYDAFLCMIALSAALREVVRNSAVSVAAEPSPSVDPTAGFVPAWRRASLKNRD
jgi:probable O-glycosylation ligase (exosortase A-associated)